MDVDHSASDHQPRISVRAV
uniref:Uncharacterized protein n=1 Tax=Anguilla anguilla TaxID=7936 RepID=A0A0E9T9Y8_ANGAN